MVQVQAQNQLTSMLTKLATGGSAAVAALAPVLDALDAVRVRDNDSFDAYNTSRSL